MNKEEIKQEPNDGLIARILGGTPTILQKVFFILMEFSLILWPLGCYVSIFVFDAPVRSDVDKICRYGMLITICLYPIYLFPLLRFMFQLSKNLRATWLYYRSYLNLLHKQIAKKAKKKQECPKNVLKKKLSQDLNITFHSKVYLIQTLQALFYEQKTFWVTPKRTCLSVICSSIVG